MKIRYYVTISKTLGTGETIRIKIGAFNDIYFAISFAETFSDWFLPRVENADGSIHSSTTALLGLPS